MMHRIAVDRGVQASLVVGGGLAVLAATHGLAWPIWVAWAAVSVFAVVQAGRA